MKSNDSILNLKKQRFIKTLLETGRKGMSNVLQELESRGFYTSPASSRYHLAYSGGLLVHSINVLDAAQGIAQMLPDGVVNDVSLIIASLLHDVCKTGTYQISEETNKYYKVYSETPFGHGEKSVIMLQDWGLKLTEEEIASIRWHMGAWSLNLFSYEEVQQYNMAIEKYPLATVIQMADQFASKITER